MSADFRMSFKAIISFLAVFFLIAFAFFIWGYITSSRKVFPYSLISREGKKNSYEGREYLDSLSLVNAYDFIKVNSTNQDSIRQWVRRVIFGMDSIPEQLPSLIKRYTGKEYSFSNVDSITELVIPVGDDYNSYVYCFHPSKPVKDILLYQQGHEEDFRAGGETIQYFIDKGVTVYAFSMPLFSKNQFVIRDTYHKSDYRKYPIKNHTWLMFRDKPLSYFILPVVSVINQIKRTMPKTHIYMVGISGGGWTTDIVSAVDERITKGFSVAGSYPLYVRLKVPESSSVGDFEQTYEPLFRSLDYLDLYVLATSRNREFVQILNFNEPCCFKYGLGIWYAGAVNRKNRELGNGYFTLFVDTVNTKHSISRTSLEFISKRILARSNENKVVCQVIRSIKDKSCAE